MSELLYDITRPEFIANVLIAIAVTATLLTVGLPLLKRDNFSARMKYVAVERGRLRRAEQARAAARAAKAKAMGQPNAKLRDVIDRFDLRDYLLSEDTVDKLKMAGYRGMSPVYTYVVVRMAMPFVFFCVAFFYLFILGIIDQTVLMKLGFCCLASIAGFFAPNVYLTNKIQNRQAQIQSAWPDALDLLLICVESGMSVEVAFNRVADEIGSQSVALAEEMLLTTAELSYLEERRQAFENFGRRTGLEGVKAVVTGLIQAEKYGTPLGQTLRILSKENRDMRMAAAEKKAAGLPPKLTVPMIVFTLPVLFVVILAPAAIEFMKLN